MVRAPFALRIWTRWQLGEYDLVKHLARHPNAPRPERRLPPADIPTPQA